MLKMIIVEDEKLEREGLVEFLDWNSFGIELIGTACDGIEGIELAGDTMPDIIITDIKMPGLGGLAMCKKIKEFHPDVKIIILTGYNDFSYAKEAISFRANDYILKPVDENEMINSIKKVVEECRLEQDIRARNRKEYYEENDKLFLKLLKGKLKEEEIKELISKLKINLNETNGLVAMILKPDLRENQDIRIIASELEDQISKNIIYECIEEDEKIVLCMLEDNSKDQMMSHVFYDIQKLFDRIDINFTLGIGITVQSLYELNESYEEAVAALDNAVFWDECGTMDNDRATFINKNKNEELREFIINGNNYLKKVLHAVSSSEEDKLKEILKELFDYINENRSIETKYIIDLFYNMLFEASTLVCSLNKNHGEILYDGSDIRSQLIELKSFKLHKDYIYAFFEKIVYIIDEKRNKKDEIIVKKVIKLIEEKYTNEISLKTVASEVFLSPNYLGNIFRKYTGKAFKDYLCEYRMEKARELLKNNNKKISTIAEEIGIPNTSYFCMVFKNTYGMAPKEYQELLLRN